MEMMVGMIAEADQATGVDIILVEYSENEDVPRDIWDAGKPEAEDNAGNTRWVIRLFG